MAAKRRIFKKTRNPHLFSKLHRKRRVTAVKAGCGGVLQEMMKDISAIHMGPKALTDTSVLMATNPSYAPLSFAVPVKLNLASPKPKNDTIVVSRGITTSAALMSATELDHTTSLTSPLSFADVLESHELPLPNIAASFLIAGSERFHQPLSVVLAEELSLSGESAAFDHHLEKKLVSVECTYAFTNDASETPVNVTCQEREQKLEEVEDISVHDHDSVRREEFRFVWTALLSRASAEEEDEPLIEISPISLPAFMIPAVT